MTDNTLVIAGTAGVANTSIAGIRINGTRILTNPFIWSAGCQAIVGTENSGAPFTRLFNGALDQSTGYFQMNEPVSTMRWTPPCYWINTLSTLGWYGVLALHHHLNSNIELGSLGWRSCQYWINEFSGKVEVQSPLISWFWRTGLT